MFKEIAFESVCDDLAGRVIETPGLPYSTLRWNEMI